jgi:hypothetical protein
MFGPQHYAPAGQSCLNWAWKAPRKTPAACHTPTCARMAEMNNAWPPALMPQQVIHEVGSEKTQQITSSVANHGFYNQKRHVITLKCDVSRRSLHFFATIRRILQHVISRMRHVVHRMVYVVHPKHHVAKNCDKFCDKS